MTIKSPLAEASIALLEARSVGMLTAEEWERLAQAIESETGERIEWRTHDELQESQSSL